MSSAILLLDANSHPNRADRVDDTALHHLLLHNQERLSSEKLAAFTDVLLQYGANPFLEDADELNSFAIANQMMEKDVLDVIYNALGR